jgi:hypothetical protein
MQANETEKANQYSVVVLASSSNRAKIQKRHAPFASRKGLDSHLHHTVTVTLLVLWQDAAGQAVK